MSPDQDLERASLYRSLPSPWREPPRRPASCSPLRTRSVPILVAFFTTSLLLVFVLYREQITESNMISMFRGSASDQSSSLLSGASRPGARNETLGFGQIFYISLPERTDRQDSMELLAAITNVTITHHPGVNGAEIPPKALPEESKGLRPGELGCWRSHADVWRRVVDEGLETALVLEDDVDWDMHVHEVFDKFGQQMRDLPGQSEGTPNAPYSLDWDVLYVGHCWDFPNNDNRPAHYVYDDKFAPNRDEMERKYASDLEGWGLNVDESTRARVLAPTWSSVCTLGYAVTRRGAERLLYNSSVRGFSMPVDLVMIDLVQKGIVKAYTVVPPLLTTWKTGSSSDSDIKDMSGTDPGKLPRGSSNLKDSARKWMEEKLGVPYPT